MAVGGRDGVGEGGVLNSLMGAETPGSADHVGSRGAEDPQGAPSAGIRDSFTKEGTRAGLLPKKRELRTPRSAGAVDKAGAAVGNAPRWRAPPGGTS